MFGKLKKEEPTKTNEVMYGDDKKLILGKSSLTKIDELAGKIEAHLSDEEKAILKEKGDFFQISQALHQAYSKYKEHSEKYDELVVKKDEFKKKWDNIDSAKAEVSDELMAEATAVMRIVEELNTEINSIKESLGEDIKKIDGIIKILTLKIKELIKINTEEKTQLEEYETWLDQEAKKHFKDVHDKYHPKTTS